MTSDLAIRVLGPFELLRDGSSQPAGGPTQRAVLAILALRAGQPVAVDDVADGIWGESDEPLSGSASIQVHVSRIRALLKDTGRQPLVTVPRGYRLEADGLSVDAVDFERLLAAGRQQLMADDAAAAAPLLADALALWRGPALMDLRDFPFGDRAAGRLDELRVDAAEEWIAARMELGEERALLPELHALIADHPYRERLHGQLMLALYRAGQQAAALDAYQAARTRLAVDLGVDPGPELERLRTAILGHADELAAPHAAEAHDRPLVVEPAQARRLPGAPDLIGRDELLAELERVAAGERLLTLTGAGGSGKTSLAVSLLHRLAPGFADGAAFVDLAPVAQADQVLPAIAGALGISQTGERLQRRLVDVLAEREVVVVLDNLEHLLDALPELAPLLDATRGLFIATSRIPLGLRAEHMVQVPPLRVPDPDEAADDGPEASVQLFLRAARAAGGMVGTAPADLASVGRICRAVDGLPLALEIAAAQTRVETVGELADHLGERLASLRARARDLPARQQTMEAAIGWSVDRLDTSQRRAFERLSVFAGSFTAAGGSAVLGTDREQTIELLGDLLDASLLTRQPSLSGQAQFRMLEPVRSVARAMGDSGELADAAAAHAAFMRAEIERLCPVLSGIRRPEDLDQLRVQHHDLIGALAHLATAGPEERIELVVQLEDYWSWTGREVVAVTLANDALEGGGLTDRATCLALALRVQFGVLLGRVDEVRTAVDQALSLAERIGDSAIGARVRLVEARFAGTVGDRDRARVAALAAVAAARAAAHARLLAQSLGEAATWHMTEGGPDLDTAGPQITEWLDEGLRIARAGEMAHVETTLLAHSLRYHDELDRNMELAAASARSAYELARRFGSPEREALFANNLGVVSLHAGGSVEDARSILVSGLRTIDRIGHRLEALYLLGSLAEAEAAAERWRNALMLIHAVVGIARSMGAGQFTLTDQYEDAVLAEGERQLGAAAAAKARAAGDRMTYREAVDFAYMAPQHA